MNELTDWVFFSLSRKLPKRGGWVVCFCHVIRISYKVLCAFVYAQLEFSRIRFDFSSIFGQYPPCFWCITPPIAISLQVIWVKWLYDYIVRAYFGCSGLTRIVLSLSFDITVRHSVMHNQSEWIYVCAYAVSVFNASNSLSCDLTLDYMCAFVLC